MKFGIAPSLKENLSLYTIPSKQMANICLKQAGIKEKL